MAYDAYVRSVKSKFFAPPELLNCLKQLQIPKEIPNFNSKGSPHSSALSDQQKIMKHDGLKTRKDIHTYIHYLYIIYIHHLLNKNTYIIYSYSAYFFFIFFLYLLITIISFPLLNFDASKRKIAYKRTMIPPLLKNNL